MLLLLLFVPGGQVSGIISNITKVNYLMQIAEIPQMGLII
jgi:hypothetical protein